ncbi:MAG TPA: WD40 repeat domain-containing protein [Gemmataceae bacterium]|jgi:WD40 repeat protein
MAEAVSFDKAALAWALPWDADWVTAVCFLGASRHVAAGNNLGQILVWDLPDKAGGAAPSPVYRLEGHTNVVTRLLASPDGRWLISASYDHSIRYWDMQAKIADTAAVVLNARAIAEASSEAGRRRGKKVPPPVEAKVQVHKAVHVLDAHREWVQGLAQNHDGTLLLSGDDAGQAILWDRPAAKELRRWQVKGWCYAMALAPDGKQALISERVPLVFDSSRHSGVRLWDATTGKPQHDLGGEFKKIFIAAAAYSPDGKVLALVRGGEANGNSGKVFLIDPATGKTVRELTPGHQDGATDLAFHPDGKHLASSGRDTVVRIWDTASGKMVKELGKGRGGQFKDWIHAISFSADGRWLAAADMAGAVQVWSFAG